MTPQEIDNLIAQIEDNAQYYEDGSIDWRGVWDAIKSTGASFKGAQFPSHDAREREWKRFQRAVEQIREIQAAEFERRRDFRNDSENHLYQVQSLAEQSLPDSGLADMILTIATGGLNMLGKAAVDAIFGQLDEAKEELKRRSQKLAEAGAYFKANKHEMLGRHKHAAHEALSDARERLNAEWDRYKSKRQAAHETRQEAWLKRQREFEERRARWRSNQYEFLERLNASKDRLEVALDHKLTNRHKLEDMRDNAKGDEFLSRVNDWYDENEAAIDSIRDKIADITDKIAEVEDQLRE